MDVTSTHPAPTEQHFRFPRDPGTHERPRRVTPAGTPPFDIVGSRALNISPVRRPNPVVRLWHWRWPVLLGSGLPAALVVFAGATHPAAALVLALSAVAGFVGWPAARRWVMRRFWAVVMPIRLRIAFTEAMLCDRAGRTPRILWSSASADVVRMWLWSPIGLGLDRIRGAHDSITTICWASGFHAEHGDRCRQLVVLVVARTRSDSWWDR